MDWRMRLPRWIFAIVVVVTWFAGMAVALTLDGLALVEFKNGLTIISPLLENWNASDASPCSWGGINCTDTGHVRNITLSGQIPMLEGNISASLGKLKLLEGLMLDLNMLSGSIPPDLGNLNNLKTLSLSFNRLDGGIPPELGNCSSLVKLALDGNMLSENIPKSLGNLTNMGSLSLGSNFLTGDITTALEELSKLPAIEQISMEANNFTGTLPPSIGNATTLVLLDLGNSMDLGQRGGGFGGQIPKELGKLVHLTTLYLGDSNFTGEIPRWLGNMSSLNALDLGQNNFTGEIPPELGNMSSLNGLWLRTNKLNGAIPSSLGNLLNLSILNLRTNKLNGTIPSQLGNLVNLTILDLTENDFTGEIPPEIGNMSSLNALFMGNNKLNGTIPSSLGKLVTLTYLQLFNNSITGSIPISFTSLINLRNVHLGFNGLIGPIPSNMSKLASVEGFLVQNNSMSGPIPEDFGRFMPNLTDFSIAYNFFNGTLPDGLCQGGKLQWLFVAGNKLQGAIPSSLASCTSLTQARLSDNQFTSIPKGFGSNSSLGYLDVSRNRLTGQLPTGLGTNSTLSILDLSENRLTGDISVLEFSQLTQNLSILNLAKNNFTGEIPAAMAMCKLLFRVDLSYNSLTGTVPLALANLSSLETLHLHGNNLTVLHPSIYSGFATTLRNLNLAENPWNAPIASEIGSLKILQILNLSYGGHTGPISSALGQLTQLEVLDLSHNNLTGEVPSGLGELMTSLVSVNVSFNNLTGSLPPAWVKFLVEDPTSFSGNPGLCLQYNANNLCVSRPLAGSRAKLKLSVGVIVGMVLGVALALVVFVAFLFWRRGPALEDMAVKNLTNAPLPFTFEEIMTATENLSDAYIIGRGGHGVVYKVECASGTRPCIVVKKIVSVDMKTAVLHKSFWSEIESVGKARHRNLVRLLGFMKRGEVGLLLYDYVSNGDLHSALHNRKPGRDLDLTWKARLRIAEGVAHGLAYLHHDYDTPIVHRDIKSSNVLLDDDLEAHISDFGLAKVLGMQPGSEQWLSTQNVLGTYGYIAPEVGYGTLVSPQLDVYSYGVLLLELLTGKEPADPSYGEALHVAAWVEANVLLNEGRMSESVLDPSLLHPKDLVATDEMLFVQEIALLCTRKNPADRPTMRDVENMLKTLSLKTEKGTGRNGDVEETVKEDGVKNKSNNAHEKVCSESAEGNKLNRNICVNSEGQGNWSEKAVGNNNAI